MRLLKIFLMILFFVGSIIFFVQNMATLSQPLALRFDPMPTFTKVADAPHAEIAALGQPATTAATPTESFLAWRSDGVPLYIVVLATFVVGVLFSCVFFLIDRIRHTYIIVGKKRRVRALEKEVRRLQADLAKSQDKARDSAEALEKANMKELPASEGETIDTTAEAKA